MSVIGKALWKTAKEQCGDRNVADFGNYTMACLFLRYLSDNYQSVAKRELGDELVKHNSVVNPLRSWMNENWKDAAAFKEAMFRNTGYNMEPEVFWQPFVETAKSRSLNFLSHAKKYLRYIEENFFNGKYKTLFSNAVFERIGCNDLNRNENFCKLVEKIDDVLNEYQSNLKELADAFSYVAKKTIKYAHNAHKFSNCAPEEVSSLLAGIMSFNNEKFSGRVLDFSCMDASNLVSAKKSMTRAGKLYGKHFDQGICNIAIMNMLVHGIKSNEFEINLLNILDNDHSSFAEQKFDAVVSIPSFTDNFDVNVKHNSRFSGFSQPPKYCADYAYLINGLHYLKDDGKMAIVLSQGALFREGVEHDIRKQVVEKGYLQAVIGLPANLFQSTGVATCIMVFDKNNQNKNVLFVNAGQLCEKHKAHNTILPEHMEKILEIYRENIEEDGLSKLIGINEIMENECNLNIDCYVKSEQQSVMQP